MKSFRLQSVLGYREMQKNEAQQKLADALGREADLIAAITQEHNELKQLHHTIKILREEGITPHELTLYENRILHKDECLIRMREKLIILREEVKNRRRTLIEANKEKKILEKLKEKHAEEEKRQNRKKEAAESDEIAGRSHGR